MSEQTSETLRFGADGAKAEPGETTDQPIVAKVPGSNPDNMVEVVLANPLNEKDREYLGLPKDAKTEVGQRLRLTRNGAKTLIEAGYAAGVDPENRASVRDALQVAKVEAGEPVSEPAIEAQTSPMAAPPSAPSTPGSDEAPVEDESAKAPEADAPSTASTSTSKTSRR